MVGKNDDKSRLIAELQQAREGFDVHMRSFRRDIDIPARFRNSFRQKMPAWVGGALVTGLLFSWLPSRKKKVTVYVDRNEGKERKLKSVTFVGLLLGFIKLILPLVKPAIMAYATKRIGDFAGAQEEVVRKVTRIEREVR